MLRVAADIRYAAIEEAVGGTLVEEWLATVGNGVPGYVTPKCAVAAIVGNEDGEILLTQRADSGVWLYPVGWADVGYSPSEVAVKEVLEETGIECEPVSLIAVLDGLRLGFARVPLYSMLFHCKMLGGELDRAPARDQPGRFLPARPASAAARGRTGGSTSRSRRSTACNFRAASIRPAPRRGAATPLPDPRRSSADGDEETYELSCSVSRATIETLPPVRSHASPIAS